MAQPLYFLPRVRREDAIPNGQLSQKLLAERGIAEIFAGCNYPGDCLVGEVTGRGPGDQSGVILCYLRPDGQIPRRTGYEPSEQIWEPVGGAQTLWIGVDSAEPPKPADLIRPQMAEIYGNLHPDYLVPLADGQPWIVPPLRRPDESTMLPVDMHFDAAGNFCQQVKRKYRGYFDAMSEVLPMFFIDVEGAEVNRPRGLQLATLVLGLVYRFGPLEQAALHLLDTTNYLMVLGRAVDLPTYMRLADAQKKNPLAQKTPSITPGSPAESSATGPATAS